ncbi:MAG: hypothetical protein K0S74_936 [Chlamydiales bacterium]|jgi:hypothetical protein|nr:hypothetical protein [Chlamydiales bacterium]
MSQVKQEILRELRDHSHIELSYIIPYYFNQDNGAALTDYLKQYALYPPELLDRIQFVLVDDGSPVKISIPTDLNLNILALRIDIDIPWNQGGARNLGVVYARSDKVLITDFDHFFPVQTLLKLVNMPHPGKNVYRMPRRDSEGAKMYRHCNTFMMSRGHYIGLYGVDEEFCGHYGFEDSMMWRWQKAHGIRFYTLSDKYHTIHAAIDRTKSYHSLKRDLSYNEALARKKKEDLEKYGPNSCHSRNFLCFPWTVVNDLYRKSNTYQRKKRPFWYKIWWLRWLWQ